ncbi:MAG: HAMP domain-containing histidine kinase [Acidimicrobiaceae bacterium]|nr:HAMP domain-containing histidine kinase [Ilumatobacter sp.]MCB9382478.1 HAMP domain-containing histidine kinase [Acidimicrobiaceae bacterium]MCO5329786.1 HAMP domain-containing histidine kinase [Ilumatobacteraceae bacterium]
MSTRLVIWLAALVVAAGLLAELLLEPPSGDERLHLLLILAAPAVVTAALVPLLRRWVSRRASVAGAALMVGVCSLAIGAATTSAASNAMFLSDHDFRLFLVVLLLSCGLALLVGVQLSAPMARDIARLGDVAEAVAAGDLSVRTAITRRDEVGRTAAALDSMVAALRAAAEERARLADARQMLFTSVGHDLRTPLAAMRAAVESLQDGVATDPDRYLGVIGSELHNVEALLDQLTAFARIESGAPLGPQEMVAVAEVADEAVEALGPLAERRGVKLALVADGPGTVRATVLDVSRCLRNLVENAITHSPHGGSVRVEVGPAADAAGEPGVEVRVLDQGPGFPAEFRDRAFEPFTRADPARTTRTGHAGLGLAITRALAQQHGGRAWLGAGPGGDVRLWFPTGGHR